MNPRPLVIVLCAVSLLAGCSKKANTDAEPAAPAPPPPPFEATFEGKTYKFLSAKIKSHEYRNESLTLSTAAGGCEVESKDGDIELKFEIGSGPGGKHYSTGPLGVSLSLDSEVEKFAARSLDGVINLAPGEWKVGNKIKGTLRVDDVKTGSDKSKKLYTGWGSFEAIVCELTDDVNRYQATPAEADKGTVSGAFGGSDPFVFKTGLAMLTHDSDRDIDRISEINFFDSDVSCDTWSAQKNKGLRVELFGPTGASGKDVILGSPQQRTVFFFANGEQSTVYGPSWVKFDSVELKKDGVVKGSFHAESGTAAAAGNPKKTGRLSGTFTATVCK